MHNVAVGRPRSKTNVKDLVKAGKMGKLYWLAVVIVLAAGLSTALYFGNQGKTVPLIKWSYFSNADEVSGAIQSRIGEELKIYQFYFLGPHPKKPLHLQSTVNIVKWIKSQGPAIVIADSIMAAEYEEIKELNPELTLDLSKEADRFLAGIKAIGPEQKVIIIAPNVYITHMLDQSPVSLMQSELQSEKYVILSFFNFPQSRDEEKDFEFACRTTESSATKLDLGCFILGQSRKFYSKEKVADKIPGLLNLIGSREYMFLLGK